MKEPAVYIMANKKHGTLYVGVTSNLVGRVHQHKSRAIEGFTQRYCCTLLVFYMVCETIEAALLKEKQLKQARGGKKLSLLRL